VVRGGRRGCSYEGRGHDFVELRPVRGDIFFAALGDVFLVHAGGFTVLVVKHLDGVHAVAIHYAEGSEALGVEGGVVLEIDEELCGAGVGPSGGEDEGAAPIGLIAGVILNGCLFPGGVDLRVGAESELGDKTRKDAKETGIVEIVMANEIVEAVGAERGPGARDGDGKLGFYVVAIFGDKFDLVGVRSLSAELARVQEGPIVGGGGMGGVRGGGFRFGRGRLRGGGDSKR